MPRKIKELIADLARAGFVQEPGKGSHRSLRHLRLPGKVTLSGKSGDDAKSYQEKDVNVWLRKLRNVERP